MRLTGNGAGRMGCDSVDRIALKRIGLGWSDAVQVEADRGEPKRTGSERVGLR